MSRAPWRPADVSDAVLGRNSRTVDVPGRGASKLMAELAAAANRELFAVVHYGETTQPQAICWPMDTSERATVFFRVGDDSFMPTGSAIRRDH